MSVSIRSVPMAGAASLSAVVIALPASVTAPERHVPVAPAAQTTPLRIAVEPTAFVSGPASAVVADLDAPPTPGAATRIQLAAPGDVTTVNASTRRRLGGSGLPTQQPRRGDRAHGEQK